MEITRSAADPKNRPERAKALRLVALIAAVAIVSSAATLGVAGQILWPSVSHDLWTWFTGGGFYALRHDSTLTVTGTRFVDFGDKAPSVGERSDMTARGLVIDGAGTGAAAKDGSVLRLDDTTIRNSRHADLMSYVKKPEHGRAGIEARNLIFAGSLRAKAQNGSAITIDGTPVATEDMDVDQLYKSIMRKGLSQ